MQANGERRSHCHPAARLGQRAERAGIVSPGLSAPRRQAKAGVVSVMAGPGPDKRGHDTQELAFVYQII
jgi:hypothetical protein